jgi:hypothetical protein
LHECQRTTAVGDSVTAAPAPVREIVILQTGITVDLEAEGAQPSGGDSVAVFRTHRQGEHNSEASASRHRPSNAPRARAVTG